MGTTDRTPLAWRRRPPILGTTTNGLAAAYLIFHTIFLLFARRREPVPPTIFLVNALLLVWFVAVLRRPTFPTRRPRWNRLLRLWVPVLFFFWAYKWAGWTLHAFFPSGFSFDGSILALEGTLLGQPSLHWARHGSRPVTELLHFFYASYYFYIPVLGIFLYRRKRYRDFEAFTCATSIGYAVSFSVFALFPLFGPRWALVDAGFLDPSEQRLKGYAITAFVNYLLWQGPALKGGAMPSSHTSTALIFAVWAWRLWGRKGGIPATILLLGMIAGAIYGRYHYVTDVVAGLVLGGIGLWVATRWVPRADSFRAEDQPRLRR